MYFLFFWFGLAWPATDKKRREMKKKKKKKKKDETNE